MVTKLTAESFLEVVKKSGLIDEERLDRFWQAYPNSGRKVDDVRAIAEELTKQTCVTRWQASKLLLGKYKGFFLGKYRLLSHLGTGGMSSVYLAEHIVMRRLVAIKVLPRARVGNTSGLERFHREAQAVASLDHPNIVRAYDIDTENNMHFLVMEYVTGQSLQELVNARGPMDCVSASEYLRQAADGLAHAHHSGMVHRDIKPGNLLVDNKGVVKILDMGLAMFFAEQDDDPLTIRNDEKVLGTADYLSPEQAVDSHTVDPRADIYSLGCTFYFLLTGHPPFPVGTLTQRLLAHQTKEPSPLEQERPDIDLDLVGIVRTMMEKKTENRYQSAKDVAVALTCWLIEHGDQEWRERNSYLASMSSQAFAKQAGTKAAQQAGVKATQQAGSKAIQPAGLKSTRQVGLDDSSIVSRRSVSAPALPNSPPRAAVPKVTAFSDTESVSIPTKVPIVKSSPPLRQHQPVRQNLPPESPRVPSAPVPSAEPQDPITMVLRAPRWNASRISEYLRIQFHQHKAAFKFAIAGALGAALAWFALGWMASAPARKAPASATDSRRQGDRAAEETARASHTPTASVPRTHE